MLIDHQTIFGNPDARLTRGLLEIHRLARVGPKGRIEGVKIRGRRDGCGVNYVLEFPAKG